MDLQGFSTSQLNLLQKQPVLITASALTSVWGDHDAEQTQNHFKEEGEKEKKREKNPRTWLVSALDDPLSRQVMTEKGFSYLHAF